MRIIYFDLDATRPDHLGIYGYPRETSPNIDKIAQEAAVFERCFASDTPCLPSRAALFSCRPGISNGVVSHEWPGCHFRYPGEHGMARPWPEYTMPMRLLQEHGYHTVTASVFGQRHAAWWFNSGFSEVLNPTRPTTHENSSSINPRMLHWLTHNFARHENLFLHVNYWDAHTPYHPDPQMHARVSAHPATDFPPQELIEHHHRNVYGPKTARDIMIRHPPSYTSHDPIYAPDEIRDRDSYKTMVDGYDASIATADAALGELVHWLKENGHYDDTAIIVSADHGEAIGQFGMYFEHGVSVDQVARVPLLFRWPGLTTNAGASGQRHDKLIYQYDFMATVVDLLGIDRPPLWASRSLKDLLAAGDASGYHGHDYLVFGCGIFSMQRTVRTATHAYVKTLHPGPYPMPKRALYDVRVDPHCLVNLADSSDPTMPSSVRSGASRVSRDEAKEMSGTPEEPEQCAQAEIDAMERRYARWWEHWCTGPDAVIDPMHIQTPDFAYFPEEQMYARLDERGRSDQRNDLEQRLRSVRRTPPYDGQPNSRI